MKQKCIETQKNYGTALKFLILTFNSNVNFELPLASSAGIILTPVATAAAAGEPGVTCGEVYRVNESLGRVSGPNETTANSKLSVQ